jgi:competence protein ComFB
MQVENRMERFVMDNLDGVLKGYPHCCTCTECRRDIVILALNHLQPRYVSTKMGDIYTRLNLYEAQEETEVIKEIAKAIQMVAKNPRHVKV